MKISKQKLLRRIINFYKIRYNFFYPFKILVDGNFYKLCLEKQFDLQDQLTKLLKGPVWLQITSCVINELNSLGEEFRDLFQQARQQPRLKCGHIIGINPKECFLELIGNYNSPHYFVCTQDLELRKKLRQILGVPVFYFSKDGQFKLEQPPIIAKKEKKEDEKKKYLPQQNEYKLIKSVQKEEKIMEKERVKKKIQKEKNELALLTKHKAQGPNPLSIKKKKRLNLNSEKNIFQNVEKITQQKFKRLQIL